MDIRGAENGFGGNFKDEVEHRVVSVSDHEFDVRNGVAKGDSFCLGERVIEEGDVKAYDGVVKGDLFCFRERVIDDVDAEAYDGASSIISSDLITIVKDINHGLDVKDINHGLDVKDINHVLHRKVHLNQVQIKPFKVQLLLTTCDKGVCRECDGCMHSASRGAGAGMRGGQTLLWKGLMRVIMMMVMMLVVCGNVTNLPTAAPSSNPSMIPTSVPHLGREFIVPE
jgi:hypothetical protein